jgi:predicted MFS family arabinose efflux permease
MSADRENGAMKEDNDGQLEIARTENAEKHSVYTTREKWCIVAMVSYAAWFSTLSNFIYYPAIPAMAKSLDVSVNKIDLTVTTYLSVATVAPALVGDAADILGRRPISIITLSIYIVTNLAIALAKSYPALLGLRMLQAMAISGRIYGLHLHFSLM